MEVVKTLAKMSHDVSDDARVIEALANLLVRVRDSLFLYFIHSTFVHIHLIIHTHHFLLLILLLLILYVDHHQQEMDPSVRGEVSVALASLSNSSGRKARNEPPLTQRPPPPNMDFAME